MQLPEHPPESNRLTHLKFRHLITLGRDYPDSFMAWHKWIFGESDFIVEHCEVRMTDPAVLNFDVYLVGCKRAQGKFERLQFAFGNASLIRRKFAKDHVCFVGLRR